MTSLSEYMGGMTNSRFERIRLHLAKVIDGSAPPKPPDASLISGEERLFYWQGARARALVCCSLSTSRAIPWAIEIPMSCSPTRCAVHGQADSES